MHQNYPKSNLVDPTNQSEPMLHSPSTVYRLKAELGLVGLGRFSQGDFVTHGTFYNSRKWPTFSILENADKSDNYLSTLHALQ